jgi:hypothetical protein
VSEHNKPMSVDLRQALINHRLPTDTPSQLADAFRFGWKAAIDAAVNVISNANTPDCGGWTAEGIAEDVLNLK